MSEKLRVHVLNVGDGDAIVVEFPDDDGKKFGVVDCYKCDKTSHVLNELGAEELEFVCATHPHEDHIYGIADLLTVEFPKKVREFWDSGFRHTSDAYRGMIAAVEGDDTIRFMRVTSGFERTINGVKVTALAPSINLRNRFDTYGVNMNNASVVLKLEYHAKGAVDASSMILGGDAQFESWGKMLEEFPHYRKTKDPKKRVQIKEAFNPLKCQMLKVSHHGSKHGTSLEYVERLAPVDAIISCAARSGDDFPDEITQMSLEDVVDPKRIYCSHHASEREGAGPETAPDEQRNGSTIAWTDGKGTWWIKTMGDKQKEMPVVPP